MLFGNDKEDRKSLFMVVRSSKQLFMFDDKETQVDCQTEVHQLVIYRADTAS